MKSIVFLLLVTLSTLLTAQVEPSSKGPLLRFTYLGLSADQGEYVLSTEKNRTEPFLIPNNGFSLPVLAPKGGGPLMVGKVTGATFQALANIILPETGDRFLVLLFPEEKNTMRSVVIRADDPGFGPGHIMLFNLVGEPIAADLDGEKLRLESGSKTVFRATRKNDLNTYQVRFYQSKQGKAKLFAASLWPYFDEKRAFVFIYKNPDTGSPTYRSIDEFTSWIKAPEDDLKVAGSSP